MSHLRRAILGAITLLAAVMLAVSPAAAAPSEQDEAWMVSAHQSNLAEIAAGTAAQEHATTEAVQDMGARLIEDHQALDADLTAAAAPVIQGHLDHLLQLADEVPGAVPSGLDGPAVPTLLGVSLIGAGVLAAGASLLVVRRGRARA